MLLMLAYPTGPIHHGFLSITESLAGVFYVSIGILGMVFAGGFLDSHILPRGNFGTLFSAGAIPLISALARDQGRRGVERHYRPVSQLSAGDRSVMGLPISQILLTTGFLLVLIGFWGMLRHRNILRIIIGFSLIDTGMHIVLVATGYVTGGTAPIIDEALGKTDAAVHAVDPIPAALVVTAIVIGFSVTAIMLSFAIRLHARQ